MNSAPKLSLAVRQGASRLEATGSWTGGHGGQLEAIVRTSPDLANQTGASLDLSQIEAMDTFGALSVRQLVQLSAKRGTVLTVQAAPAKYRGLLDQLAQTNALAQPGSKRPNGAVAALEAIGQSIVQVGSDVAAFSNMLGAVGSAILHLAANPRRFRLTSTVHQLDRVGWQAMPIIMLITLLIGGIIAQQGFFHFRRFGAEIYAVDMTGILVLREIGVLIVAIMVAGRSGSSYTAELGAMKMREEIDAMSTMGLDPIEVLIVPRILALLLALPILTFAGVLMALLGGGLMAWSYGGMSPASFVARLREAISLTHFSVGIIKAPFMALAIGVIAAMEGFKVAGSAESLGLRTTASVVKSIFLVIVLDGLFAVFFASIGM